MIVLTLNGGSSSLKFGLYRVEGGEPLVLMNGASTDGALSASDASGAAMPDVPLPQDQPEAVVRAIAALLSSAALPAPDAIGHRVVHGGPTLRAHCLIGPPELEQLRSASAMSPLHAPASLAMIKAAGETFPGIPQVACFDTAFHASLPDEARTLPLPRALRDAGIQRYGFHGLSCESIVRQLGCDLPDRLIVAHLGSGASVTAIRDGRSIDTSMGLTPSGGLMMATRSGELDPGVLIYLLREKEYDAATLDKLIDHQSGLLGVSGVSSDMRQLHASAAACPDARLAIAMFCRSVAKQIAAMMVVLGGADMLVFTGGIGEHDEAVRAAVGELLRWAGVAANKGGGQYCSGHTTDRPQSCDVRVLPSREDEQIARHVADLAAAPNSFADGPDGLPRWLDLSPARAKQ